MFVQVIEGKAKDAAGLRAAMDEWQAKLASGAKGWLGGTGGVADDGTFFVAARFASEEEARRNSDRPEQGRWWEQVARNLEGEASFSEYTNVEMTGEGGSDSAGFVQVMRGRSSDIERLRQLGKELEAGLRKSRPEVIGSVVAWKPDGDFTQIVYFTSEREAREGEGKNVPEMERFGAEFGRLVQDLRYIDLREPWLTSP